MSGGRAVDADSYARTVIAEARQERLPRRRVSGIVLLDKPVGLSSNDALQRVRRAFRAQKAGHTGNLDVAAGGLLPICLGEATKVCAFLLDAEKRYRAEFKLGIVTTTGDREGEVVSRAAEVRVARPEVEAALARFRGEIEQVPPMYSALKHAGQPLYKLARKGASVPRNARRVTIHRLELVYCDGDVVGVDVVCSKGTYIRTLAEAVGEALGCGAHMSGLQRSGVGPYDLKDAYPLPRFEAEGAAPEQLDRLLLPIDSALGGFVPVILAEAAVRAIRCGKAVTAPDAPTGGLVRLYDAAGVLLGIGAVGADGSIAPKRLLALAPATSAKKPGISPEGVVAPPARG